MKIFALILQFVLTIFLVESFLGINHTCAKSTTEAVLVPELVQPYNPVVGNVLVAGSANSEEIFIIT